MTESIESKDIETLLAEADELIQQINSDVINDMKEKHRMEFEEHTQKLKMIKSEVLGKIEKKKSSGAEGMHQAIQDIVKAFQDLTKHLS